MARNGTRTTDADLERRDARCGHCPVSCGVTRITVHIPPTCLPGGARPGPEPAHPLPARRPSGRRLRPLLRRRSVLLAGPVPEPQLLDADPELSGEGSRMTSAGPGLAGLPVAQRALGDADPMGQLGPRS